jgi:hypothetical protein
MQAAKDPNAAAEIFMRGYERPKAGPTEALAQRQAYADAIASGKELPKFGAAPVASSSTQTATAATGLAPKTLSDEPKPWETIGKKILPDAVPTDSSFWVPLIAGLGTMLASDKYRFSQRLGEGLVGGAAAYMKSAAQEAEIGKTRATTEKEYADIAGNSIKTINGVTFVRHMLPNGSYGWVDIGKWWDNPEKYRVDPRVSEMLPSKPATETQTQIKPPVQEAPKPPVEAAKPTVEPAKPAPAPAPSTTEQPAEAAPAPIGGVIRLSKGAAESAKSTAQQLRTAGETGAKDIKDVYTPQAEIASAMQNQRPQLATLATNLASLPRDKSISASGKPQEIMKPVVSYLNGLGAIVGLPEIANGANLATQQDIDKLVSRMQLQATTDAGQKAYSAFKDVATALPTYLSTPQGQAKMLSDIYVQNQREIDKNNYFTQYKKEFSDVPGATQFAQRSGSLVDQHFNDDYSTVHYGKEREALEKMFNTTPMVKDKPLMENGRPVSWMEFLNKHAGDMSQGQKAFVEKTFGPGILRYYGIGK